MTQTVWSDTPAAKRSRRAYALECSFEYFVSIFVSDAFLAKLLTRIGISDAVTGIISSLVSLSFLFQFFSVFAVQRITNTKRFVTVIHTLSGLLFMCLYFVPFLPFAVRYKELLTIVCILCAYFGNYFVSTILFKWANSYVDPYHRAEYSGVKEMISLLSGIVVSLAVGKIIDSFEAVNALERGFLFVAAAIFLFTLCDLICLLLIQGKKPSEEEKKETVPLREVMHATFGSKNFRRVIILSVLWCTAVYTTRGFLGTYQVNPHELAFSVGTIQVFQLIGNLGRFFATRPFGRFSDRTSYTHGIKTALLFGGAAFACGALIAPRTRFLVPVYMILYAVCLAGQNQNMMNITYSYVDQKYLAQAMAIKNSIGGLCGFFASLLASRLLVRIQNNGNSFLGIPVYGQQVLCVISFLLLVAEILFIHFAVEKQTVLRQ